MPDGGMRARMRSAIDSVRHQVTGPVYDVEWTGDGFALYMERPHHRVLRGAFEPWTREAIVDAVGPDSVFWEVGARWGVFSWWLLANDRVGHATLFEADPMRVAHCAQSMAANDVEGRAHIHSVRLSERLSLDEFDPMPDVVLVDLEGAEFEVVPTSTRVLEEHPTWIVEQHDHGGGLRATFEAFGYDVRQLHEDADREWLVAEGPA